MSLSAQSNAVFELMERMPTFWQTADVPLDYPMTMSVSACCLAVPLPIISALQV